jgi:hypothetical protein
MWLPSKLFHSKLKTQIACFQAVSLNLNLQRTMDKEEINVCVQRRKYGTHVNCRAWNEACENISKCRGVPSELACLLEGLWDTKRV